MNKLLYKIWKTTISIIDSLLLGIITLIGCCFVAIVIALLACLLILCSPLIALIIIGYTIFLIVDDLVF